MSQSPPDGVDVRVRDLAILGPRTLRRAHMLTILIILGHALWLLLYATDRLDMHQPWTPLVVANAVAFVVLVLASITRQWRAHACLFSVVVTASWGLTGIIVSWPGTGPTWGYWATLGSSVTAWVAADAWSQAEV